MPFSSQPGAVLAQPGNFEPGAFKLVTLVSLSGAMTPSGTLSKQVGKSFTGAMTPSGIVQKRISKAISGVLTMAGALSRTIRKSLAGTLAPVGSLGKTVRKFFVGALTLAGSLSEESRRLRDLVWSIGAVQQSRWIIGRAISRWSIGKPRE